MDYLFQKNQGIKNYKFVFDIIILNEIAYRCFYKEKALKYCYYLIKKTAIKLKQLNILEIKEEKYETRRFYR